MELAGAERSKFTNCVCMGNLDLGKAVNSVSNHHSNIYDSHHCLFAIYLTPVTPASGCVNSSMDISKEPQTAASYTLSPADELGRKTQNMTGNLRVLLNNFDPFCSKNKNKKATVYA